MGASRKSPLAQSGANRALKENIQSNFTRSQNNKPPPLHIAAYVKNVLVQLGANGILSPRFCTKLINILGLRGK